MTSYWVTYKADSGDDILPKKELKKYKINVSEVIRKALEEEIRRKLEELRKELMEVSTALSTIPKEEWVRLIREGKEEH